MPADKHTDLLNNKFQVACWKLSAASQAKSKQFTAAHRDIFCRFIDQPNAKIIFGQADKDLVVADCCGFAHEPEANAARQQIRMF